MRYSPRMNYPINHQDESIPPVVNVAAGAPVRDLRIFADAPEEGAIEQINLLLAQPAFRNAKVRIMPDVHAGKGCVIGFTADLGDKVIPNVVGVDIGCGMLTVELGAHKPDFAALDDIMHRNIPSGQHVHHAAIAPFEELDALHCLPHLKWQDRLRASLGSLGGGNHFVEVDVDSQGHYYLIIHSGSRNLGTQVCDHYQKEAIHSLNGAACSRERQRELVERLKAAGRHEEIAPALAELKKRHPHVPDQLCYLAGEARLRYLDDMRICQLFASRNREVMADIILRRLGLTPQGQFHTVHNYIAHEDNIVRKGAISAAAGERLLIPINMRDGCIYGTGKGNEDWNKSAPHGAGRLMSRTAALRELSLEEFREQMAGIYSSSVLPTTLDEAPMAYKGMDAILSRIGPTVDVVDIFKPVYNYKAS